ncbi:hypothetical protein BOTBODRAFT_36624 [Botryobasidium botryosum FD-172 SS1]|uniref:Retrovirus-related Pol polyprotein from transposon TNT 1-94-like beta-barrel domain-containing protein n=1 Tax=Botryobasidium botryosum (strain FD-172 SS1) TaxID=930990 RepID=A0A067MEJ9_BOTB1|nr:hypothetical protein BOTBODRAFT_36624 [Botryobasidium botryosum FD-172 SS1]
MQSNLDIPDFARPPNLNVDGSNWYIYSVRMTLFLKAKGLYKQVEPWGNPYDSRSHPKLHMEYKQRDDTAKLIIASTIPDSLLLLVHDRPVAYDMWKALVQEFRPKNAIFKAGFEKHFKQVRSIAHLVQCRETLAGAGGIISHDDYFRQIVLSLNHSYPSEAKACNDFIAEFKKDPVANWIPFKHNLDHSIVSARDISLPDADEEMESDIQLQSADRNSESEGRPTRIDVGIAPPGDKVTGNDGPSGARSASQHPSRVSREALQEAPTSGTPSSFSPTAHDAAHPAISHAGSPDTRHEVYSTVAPHHISPHRHDFVTFTPFEPKAFKSALGSTLIATGIGDLPIFVPDGNSEKPVLLQNAYYAPKLSATLVSLPQLSQEWEGDLSIGTSGDALTATSDEGVVASIPMCDGLHQVTHQVSLDLIARAKRMAFEFHPV